MHSYLQKSTVQLCQIDADRKPLGIASGCLVFRNGKRFLLTVEHATGNQGNWAIELDYDKAQGTKLYQLGGMNFIKKWTLPGGTGETVDFSYVTIPDDLEVFRHYLTPQGDTLRKDVIHTYSSDLTAIPKKEEGYGFSGCIMPELNDNLFQPNRPHFIREFRSYEGLTFVREDGDFSVFKLPFNHPGHEHFQGCSGAPMINTMNEPVGLVCKGFSETGEIYAISLPKMAIILDASILAERSQK